MEQTGHDAPIEAAKAELEKEKSRLAALQAQIIDAAKAPIAEWFKRTIEREVKEKAHITKALTPDRLKKLKEDMNKLVADTPRLVAEVMSAPAIWPLQGEWPQSVVDNSNIEGSKFRHDSVERILPALKKVLGHAGKLLVEAGYVTHKDQEWQNQNSPLPTYSPNYLFDSGKPLKEKIKEYTSQAYKVGSAYENLKQARVDKERAEAKDLWDSA